MKQPMAPVLKIDATVDGKTAPVGLDTYAGCGMVLDKLVEDRKAAWRPTFVMLEGVAKEVVRPRGEVNVTVSTDEMTVGGQRVERRRRCDQDRTCARGGKRAKAGGGAEGGGRADAKAVKTATQEEEVTESAARTCARTGEKS